MVVLIKVYRIHGNSIQLPIEYNVLFFSAVSAGDEMWADDPSVFSDFDTEPTGMEFPSESRNGNSMIAWMCIFLLSLRAAHKIYT